MNDTDPDRSIFYAVDRIESTVAVLQDDEGQETVVPANRLPRELKEGDILAVPVDGGGTVDWGLAQIDVAETERRRRAAAEVLERLLGRDGPVDAGGD